MRKDKIKGREYQRNWYLKNKEKRIAQIKKNRSKYKKRNKKFVLEYLLSHPCVDCGENDPIVLEFDHISNKKANISCLMKRQVSLETIQKEIEKCEVRCANCHRKITHSRRLRKIMT